MMEALARLLPNRRGLGRLAVLAMVVMVASGAAGYLLDGLTIMAYLFTGVFFLGLFVAFSAATAILAKTTFESRQTRMTPDRIPRGLRIYLFLFSKGQIRRLAADNLLGNAFAIQCFAIWIIGLVIAALLPVDSRASQAIAIGNMNEMRLLTEPKTPVEVLERRMSRVSFSADRAPDLDFSIVVPHGWSTEPVETPLPAPGGGLARVAAWSAPDGAARVDVYAQRLLREVHSLDWFLVWGRANGYRILDQRSRASGPDIGIDVLAIREAKGADVVRLRTYRKAGLLFMVAASTARHRLADQEEAMLVAVESFDAGEVPPDAFAEPMREVEVSGPVAFHLIMPEIWSMRRDTDAGADTTSLFFANPATPDRVVGLIHVMSAPRDRYASDKAVAADLLAMIERDQKVTIPEGAELAQAAEIDGRPARQLVTAGRNAAGEPVRVAVTVTGGQALGGWISLLLVGNRPDPDPFLIDGINARAYDIARRSLSLR
ncbi:hypothetical protein WI697_18240 [Tistrella mobilis]|uniref:hypothetical protein n=1 Tax=Tistrella mobilis TaxID=171437 RepID=UPI0031F66DE8